MPYTPAHTFVNADAGSNLASLLNAAFADVAGYADSHGLAGDNVAGYFTAVGQAAFATGTAGTPDTVAGPGFKVSRTSAVLKATTEALGGVGTDGCDSMAAIHGSHVGTAAAEAQPIGVYGSAKSSSTAAGVGGGTDACGLYGLGRITGSGIGTGIGGFFAGRRDTATGRACGLEVHCYNGTSTAESYSTTSFPNALGIWVNAGGGAGAGGAQSAAGMIFGNAFGRQFEVGIAFNAMVNNSLTGPTLTSDIRSDSSATTSIQINGTHSTAAICVALSAGVTRLGNATSTGAGSVLEVIAPSGSVTNNVVNFGGGTSTTGFSVRIGNGSGSCALFSVAGTDNFLTGTAQGDTGIVVNTSGKVLHIGGTISTIKVTQANTLGFFNVTPVARQSVNAAATDPATTQSLANSLRTALINLGLAT